MVRSIFVLTILLLPAFAHAGVFNAIFGFMAEADVVEEAETAFTPNVQTMPLLRGVINADPNASHGGGDVVVDEDGVLVPGLGPSGLGDDAKESNGEISTYVVREDDSLSQIAHMFGVSVNTILWANAITDRNTIRPGDTLVILPVSGVRHVVKTGDTLKSIASKYQGDVDDIIAYNQLGGASDIAPGDTVVIPGGEVAAPKPTAKPGKGVASSGAGGNSALINPVPGSRRTQGIHGYNGVDLGAAVGTPIRAAAGGTVILARGGGAWNGGYGNYVVIKHANGTQTLYAHMSKVTVAAGAAVGQGQTIGYVGMTGKTTGAHVHFEVRGGKNPF